VIRVSIRTKSFATGPNPPRVETLLPGEINTLTEGCLTFLYVFLRADSPPSQRIAAARRSSTKSSRRGFQVVEQRPTPSFPFDRRTTSPRASSRFCGRGGLWRTDAPFAQVSDRSL